MKLTKQQFTDSEDFGRHHKRDIRKISLPMQATNSSEIKRGKYVALAFSKISTLIRYDGPMKTITLGSDNLD